ncbi:MAG: bifunctional phosphoribosylaminoimidazolecarboxamide formyltransferase/IMP cyclohydrolase [Rectinemataceae bacterium]
MPLALVSVHDKTGLAGFARRLHAAGWSFLASGGTFRTLREAGIPAREVSEYTGSPEMLGGRVKTLHPAIHGGILARPGKGDADELSSAGWEPIDLVVVNLYPFEETVARSDAIESDIIEEIDIGGVALIRAAAKNHARVTVLCDRADYDAVADAIEREGLVPAGLKRKLAAKGFARTASYDAAIAAWFDPDTPDFPRGRKERTLRYGENPHQKAEYYSWAPGKGPLGGEVLRGKELSYNNILDLDAAWRAVALFDAPAAVVVKHLSPCGIACAESAGKALSAAIACDPVSAFGGVVACNREFDGDAVRALGDLFAECIAAPGFDAEALELLARRKNLRLVVPGKTPDTTASGSEFRSVVGGFLRQDTDSGDPADAAEWRVVTKRAPTETECVALRFAWKACISVKSNAIVLADGTATVGIGGGQPNRVDSMRIAAARAGTRASGSVMASDAFFPFADSVEEAARSGVTAIVQPGGSVRDAESVAAADAAGIAMVMTGIRHFRH